MKNILLRLRGVAIALVVLALSASLAFGAQAPASGYALGSSYKDNVKSHEKGGGEDAGEEESTEEDTDESSGDGGDNCLTDPTGLTDEELAAMTHGSIVCWAAHQDTPEGYANHGAWVSEWAKMGKGRGSDAAAAGKAKGQGQATDHGPAN